MRAFIHEDEDEDEEVKVLMAYTCTMTKKINIRNLFFFIS